MARAAALNFVSDSSSSSERVSRRCIAASALFCSIRTCRCFAMGRGAYVGAHGSCARRLLGVAVQGLAGGPVSAAVPAARLAGGLRAALWNRRGQLELLPTAQERR